VERVPFGTPFSPPSIMDQLPLNRGTFQNARTPINLFLSHSRREARSELNPLGEPGRYAVA
jgi:hypothetical protein